VVGDAQSAHVSLCLSDSGSRGIGEELVKILSNKSITVCILDVLAPTYTLPSNVYYFATDVSKLVNIQETYSKICSEIGTPTILCANAGIVRGRTILDATEEDIRKTFEINVLGVFWVIKTFLPDMLKNNHGHILITASSTAFLSVAGAVDYAASKAAVNSIYDGLQTELKHKYGNTKVKASAIFPATIKTAMFEGIIEPSAFWAPPLPPMYVAKRMYDILLKGRSETVLLPAMTNFAAWAQMLPTWMKFGMQDAGATAMDNLKNVPSRKS